MGIAADTFAIAYYCPMCGIDLTASDFDKAPEDYSCPFCCSRQRPSRVTDRVGWEYPD
jgi:predicted RNA-binding Zn-ribbon protein involved in translation (DUF1610 family)